MYHCCIRQFYKHLHTWHSMAHKALPSLICPHKTRCTKHTNWRTYKFTVIHWYNDHIPTLVICTKIQNTHTDVCIQIKHPIVTNYVHFYKNCTLLYMTRCAKRGLKHTSDFSTLRILSLQLWNVATGLIYHCSDVRENFSLTAYSQVKLYNTTYIRCMCKSPFCKSGHVKYTVYISEKKHFMLYSMRPHQCRKHKWLAHRKWTSWRIKSYHVIQFVASQQITCCITTNNLFKSSKCNFQY